MSGSLGDWTRRGGYNTGYIHDRESEAEVSRPGRDGGVNTMATTRALQLDTATRDNPYYFDKRQLLGLWNGDVARVAPDDMEKFAESFSEQSLAPIGLQPLSPRERKMFSGSINPDRRLSNDIDGRGGGNGRTVRRGGRVGFDTRETYGRKAEDIKEQDKGTETLDADLFGGGRANLHISPLITDNNLYQPTNGESSTAAAHQYTQNADDISTILANQTLHSPPSLDTDAAASQHLNATASYDSIPPLPQQQPPVIGLKPEFGMWYYRDPSGNIQGPFTGLEMHDWYIAGFFQMSLLVRREGEADFMPLSALIRQTGNQQMPFLIRLPGRMSPYVTLGNGASAAADNGWPNVQPSAWEVPDRFLSPNVDVDRTWHTLSGPSSPIQVQAATHSSESPAVLTPPNAPIKSEQPVVEEEEEEENSAVSLTPAPSADFNQYKGVGAERKHENRKTPSAKPAPWAVAVIQKNNSQPTSKPLKDIQALETQQRTVSQQQAQQIAPDKIELPSKAKWASTGSGSSPTTIRKSLALIQSEEEERSRQTAASGKLRPGQVKRFADIAQANLPRQATTAKSIPLVTTEDAPWQVVGPSGKPNFRKPLQPVIPAKPASTALPRSSQTPTRQAQDDFVSWCRSALKELNPGTNFDEFYQMLLSFSPESKDTQEIVSDIVYANSATLDGRRFAAEYIKRRKALTERSIVNGITKPGIKPNAGNDEDGGGEWNIVPKRR